MKGEKRGKTGDSSEVALDLAAVESDRDLSGYAFVFLRYEKRIIDIEKSPACSRTQQDRDRSDRNGAFKASEQSPG